MSVDRFGIGDLGRWTRILTRDDALMVERPLTLLVLGEEGLIRQVMAEQLVREFSRHGGCHFIDWAGLMDFSVELASSIPDAFDLAGALARESIDDALDRSVHCLASLPFGRLAEIKYLLERCAILDRPVVVLTAGAAPDSEAEAILADGFGITTRHVIDSRFAVSVVPMAIEASGAEEEAEVQAAPEVEITLEVAKESRPSEDLVPPGEVPANSEVATLADQSASEIEDQESVEDEYVEIRRGNSVIRVRKPRASASTRRASESVSRKAASSASDAGSSVDFPAGGGAASEGEPASAPRASGGDFGRPPDARSASAGTASDPEVARRRLEQIQRIRDSVQGGG